MAIGLAISRCSFRYKSVVITVRLPLLLILSYSMMASKVHMPLAIIKVISNNRFKMMLTS